MSLCDVSKNSSVHIGLKPTGFPGMRLLWVLEI